MSSLSFRSRGVLPAAQVAVIEQARATAVANRTRPGASAQSRDTGLWDAALADPKDRLDATPQLVAALEAYTLARARARQEAEVVLDEIYEGIDFDVYVHPVTWADAARCGLAGPDSVAIECHVPMPGAGVVCVCPSVFVPVDQWQARGIDGSDVCNWLYPQDLDREGQLVYERLRGTGVEPAEAADAARDTLARQAACPPSRKAGVRASSGSKPSLAP